MSVVAISRQVGSLGEQIGKLVSSQLGMELITRSRIHEFITEYDPPLNMVFYICQNYP